MKNTLFIIFILLFTACSNDSITTYQLDVTISPVEGGTTNIGNSTYEEGATANITATPNEGWEFVEWRGSINSTDNPLSITFNNDVNLEAVFEQFESLVIFTINDQHGQINNFAKIKHIIDQEKETEKQVFFVSGGDAFSGNPIVDFHEQKGYPMIDLMNKSGLDVSVLGNHEFDYGQDNLNARMEQANYEYICANLDVNNGTLNDPKEYITIEKDGVKITFLGLVQVSSGSGIPATHPNRVKGITFYNPFDKIKDYSNLESSENSDLLVLLSHCGFSADQNLASNNDFVDLIIGGHSHTLGSEVVNNIPIVQAGGYLNYLTKISLTINDNSIQTSDIENIDLNTYAYQDESLKVTIDDYNNKPEFFEVIGFSKSNLNKNETGCFYTDALRIYTNADLVIQNTGGVRNNIDYGDITPYEIYSVDPFGNALESYTMTAEELKNIFSETRNTFYYAGISISTENNQVVFRDQNGNTISNSTKLKLSVNDYITSLNPQLFPEPDQIYPLTTAQAIVEYLKAISDSIDYEGCANSYSF